MQITVTSKIRFKKVHKSQKCVFVLTNGLAFLAKTVPQFSCFELLKTGDKVKISYDEMSEFGGTSFKIWSIDKLPDRSIITRKCNRCKKLTAVRLYKLWQDGNILDTIHLCLICKDVATPFYIKYQITPSL